MNSSDAAPNEQSRVTARLSILHDNPGPVARQGDRIISRTAFLSEIADLARQLPDSPYIINLCNDRYRFTVGWLAAMARGQITLLPSSRDIHAVAALRQDYAPVSLLTDNAEEAWPTSTFVYPSLDLGHSRTIEPAFPPDQVAAILFTSGSTGRPNPSPRRWGRLIAGAQAAGAALDVARFPGSALVATVPHGHSYGLESAVVLPLLYGLLLTAERPFFPADVAAALEQDPMPAILVTTPVHLKALVGDAAGPGFGTSFRAGFVLSATAPLGDDLARRAEDAFNAPVREIYGCSEAGQLASRRTTEGPVWRTLDGFRLYRGETGCWASGPTEDDVMLADEIEPVGPNTFTLQGRTADLVNVAGKRSSLGYLTQQLLAIEGVRDGVFLLPPSDADGATPRLAAVAIAPGQTPAQILARLRERIDAAFLPRPLHVVETLPRNELGKLPRAELLRLIGKPVLIRFPADHPTGPGHFPGNPIIPGAVLLDEVLAAVFPDVGSGAIDAAKFHRPVRPGDTIAVTCHGDGAATRFECRLTHSGADSGEIVLTGVVRL
ncbi:MAG TPA: AMP-binding protein [Rhodopila sp.]|uniref:AMP-binding protein n=1 Tax=Rhodopila sp. TaxID=2480087 RepID=UPI002C52B673|nr:AMP-binding protein [Rhodopila sp.]HVY16320.1 AMP-binding protein [Rhodopila sp.]